MKQDDLVGPAHWAGCPGYWVDGSWAYSHWVQRAAGSQQSLHGEAPDGFADELGCKTANRVDCGTVVSCTGGNTPSKKLPTLQLAQWPIAKRHTNSSGPLGQINSNNYLNILTGNALDNRHCRVYSMATLLYCSVYYSSYSIRTDK